MYLYGSLLLSLPDPILCICMCVFVSLKNETGHTSEEYAPLFKKTRTSKENQTAIQEVMELQNRMEAKNIDTWG